MMGAFLFADPTEDDADDPTHPRYGGAAFDRHVTLVKDAQVASVDYGPSADAATREGAVDRLHTAPGWVIEPAQGAIWLHNQGFRDAEVQIGE